MSEPTIRRKARRKRFTVLDNQLIEDRSINFAALGVLTYLLSKPDDWTVLVTDLQRRGGIGRMALRAIMSQLKDAGYAQRKPVRTATGVAGSCWEISEESALTVRKPDRQNTRRSANLTVRESTPLVSTDSVPSTETAPTTDNVVVVAPRPAPPDHDDDALQNASSASAGHEDQEALEVVAELLAPIKQGRARQVLAAVHVAAPGADADDIQAAAEDWLARMERIKGHAPDPITASQLPDVVAAHVSSRRRRPAGHGLIPQIDY